MANGVRRVTVSLPPLTLNQLDFVAAQLGVSRSAFISALLGDILPPLVPMAKLVKASQEGSEADSKRYRGEFASTLDDMVKKLNAGYGELQDDMFKE